MSTLVAVIMGSTSDEERMAGCGELLDRFGIEYEQHVMSAHRTPDKVADFARGAADAGIAAFSLDQRHQRARRLCHCRHHSLLH